MTLKLLPNQPPANKHGLNRYCEKAGLTSAPKIEDFVRKPDIRLFHLMIVALLERGAPMSLEELAARLAHAGVTAQTGDLIYSLIASQETKARKSKGLYLSYDSTRQAQDLHSNSLCAHSDRQRSWSTAGN